jgi:hypothetical protein
MPEAEAAASQDETYVDFLMNKFSTSEIKDIRTATANHIIEFKNGETYSVRISEERQFLNRLIAYHRDHNSQGQKYRHNLRYLLYCFDND